MTNNFDALNKFIRNNIIIIFIHNNTFIKSVYSRHCQNHVQIGNSSFLFIIIHYCKETITFFFFYVSLSKNLQLLKIIIIVTYRTFLVGFILNTVCMSSASSQTTLSTKKDTNNSRPKSNKLPTYKKNIPLILGLKVKQRYLQNGMFF